MHFTFAWLRLAGKMIIHGMVKDVEAGGGTAYIQPGFDGVIMPEKGAG